MILFVTNAYPDFPGSYRGHFIREMAAGLARSGYAVIVVTPRVFDRSPLRESGPEGTEVIRFAYPSGNRQLLEYKTIPYLRMAVFLISGLITTIRAARSYKCRAIHAHWVVPTGFLAAIAGSLLKMPVIVHARGTDVHTYAVRNPLMRLVTGWTLRRARALIATSHEIKNAIAESFQIPAARIHVIPTGINPELFSPQRKGRTGPSSRAAAQINLIYIGGLYPPKGIEYLLKAVNPIFRQNDSLHLTLVGEGPLKMDILKWIQHQGLQTRISLAGSLPHDQIPLKLRRSHIFILPSLREGTPNSLLEAMACGIPSIATRVGHIASIIDDGKDGLLVNPGSSDELKAKITLLLDDPALYRRIAKTCRNKALRYSQSESLKRIIGLYNEL
jgi:glycosyltransferase involved in cell wall biosynthesis